MMGGGGMMGGYWNAPNYLDALKTQLGITANEEPAWKEYADTVLGVGEQMRGLHQNMFAAMGSASWQQRRDLMNQMFQARQQAFETVHEAAAKLMSALTPAQQTKAQGIVPGLGYGPGMMGWGGSGQGASDCQSARVLRPNSRSTVVEVCSASPYGLGEYKGGP